MKPVLRWAWRMFRKEWRQQLLVLSLLILAVAAAVTGAALTVNGATSGRGEFGDATGLVRVDGENPARAQALIDAAKRRFGAVEVIGHTAVPIPGSTEVLDIRAQETRGRFSGPLLALRSGRYPTAAGEIALTRSVAKLLEAHVGSSVSLARQSFRVVGEVENPSALGDDFALVPVTHAAAGAYTVLISARLGENAPPPRSSTSKAREEGPALLVQGAPHDDSAVATTVLIMTTVGMALVALIAGAGFVVLAQRRQRQLGLLGALGATERHLRLVVLANGLIVGLVAAAVGGVLGVLGWMASAPALETGIGHRLDRFNLPWTLTLICLALAVVAATAAAWWPARTMARLPIMSALSRRPVPPSPVHRSLIGALAFVAAGMGAIIVSGPTTDHVKPLFLMGGLLLLIIGSVLAAPGAVRLLARPTRRMPFPTRLALRDLVRYQARAAASLAAITLGLGIAVTIVVLAQANVYAADEGNLSSHQLLIRAADGPSEVGQLEASANAVGVTIEGGAVVPLEVAFSPAVLQNANMIHEPVSAVMPISHGFRGQGATYVATPAVLASLGIKASDVRADTELITSSPKKLTLLDVSTRPDPNAPTVAVQRMNLPKFESGPRFLITESALAKHGWTTQRDAWLVASPHVLTSKQIATARKLAATTGLEIEVRSSQDDLAALRNGATAVGALLALAIVAMTIGLLRGESVRDLRTLTATGAPSQIRRAITASTASALALLGVVVSVVASYAALIAAYHSQLDKLSSPPFMNLVSLAIGLPLVAAAGGWLLGGREPVTFSRQALD